MTSSHAIRRRLNLSVSADALLFVTIRDELDRHSRLWREAYVALGREAADALYGPMVRCYAEILGEMSA